MNEHSWQKLLDKKLTRKQFLLVGVFAVASATGVLALMRQIGISGATATTAGLEPESGTLAGGASIFSDASASSGNAIKFGSVTTPPPVGQKYGPVSYPSLQAALDAGLGPENARSASATLANGDPVYVLWPASAPTRKLHEQFALMKDGQILVLPERALPYEIDSSQGFCASGVTKLVDTSLPAGQQEIPIVSSRGWFTMARAKRGIFGLGPGAVVRPNNTGWTRPAQGNPSQLSYQYGTSTTLTKITGCQEKLIETGNTQPGGAPYFGNFVLQGRNFGPVAYSAITSASGTVFERMLFRGASRGFSFAPNGESGCISIANYVIKNVELDGRDPDTNEVVGTSVFMANRATGGTVDHLYVHDFGGGPAIWECSGQHTWNNYVGPGFNLEASSPPINGVSSQFYFNINDGEITTPREFNVRSPYMSQKITLRGTKITDTVVLGNIWSSGSEPRKQLKADIQAFDAAGNPMTVSVPGGL